MRRFALAGTWLALNLFLAVAYAERDETESVAGAADAEKSLRAVLHEYRDYFYNHYKAEVARHKKGEVRNGVAMQILPIFEKMGKEPLDAGDYRLAFSDVLYSSRVGLFSENLMLSGFVDDDPSLRVLVSALKSEEEHTVKRAVEWLTWHVRHSARRQFEKEIRAALGKRPRYEAILLYAKCDLTEEERNEALSWSDTPAAARAYMGDTKAETELIEKFERSNDYWEKSRLALQLGYVGTPRCVEALVDGLRSTVASKGGGISVRREIVRAIGLVYENEPLFTRYAYYKRVHYDDTFDKKVRKLDDYIGAIDRWVQDKFGRSAWGEEDVWFSRLRLQH